MAFPNDVGGGVALYDAFTGANTASIVGRTTTEGFTWDGNLFSSGFEDVGIAANAARDSDMTGGYSTILTSETWQDVEITAVISAATGSFKGEIFVRIADGGTDTADGYTVYVDTSIDFYAIYRIDNGSYSSALDSSFEEVVLVNGDEIGVSVVGSTIKMYYDIGSGWTELLSATDATYSAAGQTGFSLETAGSTLDDYSVTSNTQTLEIGTPPPAPAPEGHNVTAGSAALAIGTPPEAPAPEGMDVATSYPPYEVSIVRSGNHTTPATSGVASQTLAIDCTDGDTLAVLVGVRSNSITATATYNGVSMAATVDASTNTSATSRAYMFTLDAPASGTNDFVVTYSANSYGPILYTVLTGVDSIRASGGTGNNSTSDISLAVASEDGDLLIGGFFKKGNGSYGLGTGLTSLATHTRDVAAFNDWNSQIAWRAGQPSSTTAQFTSDASGDYSVVAATFSPAVNPNSISLGTAQAGKPSGMQVGPFNVPDALLADDFGDGAIDVLPFGSSLVAAEANASFDTPAGDSSHGTSVLVTIQEGSHSTSGDPSLGGVGTKRYYFTDQSGNGSGGTGTANYTEAYLRYYIYFNADFDPVLGGKGPGLAGGIGNSGGGFPAGDDGWSSRINFDNPKVDNRIGLNAYTYSFGQPGSFGEDIPFQIDGNADICTLGEWHCIEQRVVMNSVGSADGVLQCWLDGVLAVNRQDMEWRDDASLGVDHLFFSVFMGGAGAEYAAAKDEDIFYDDFWIGTQPRGLSFSGPGFNIGTVAAPQPEGMDIEGSSALTLEMGTPDPAPQPEGVDVEPSGSAALSVGSPDPPAAPGGHDLDASGSATLAIGEPDPAPSPEGASVTGSGAVALSIGTPDPAPEPEGHDLEASGSVSLTIGTSPPSPQPEGVDVEASGAVTLGIGSPDPSPQPNGASLTPGDSTLAIGTPDVSPAPEGVDLAASGSSPLAIGSVTSPAPEGVDVEPGTATLAIGTPDAATAPEGHDLDASGSATLAIGTPDAPAAPDGVTLTPTGSTISAGNPDPSPAPEGMDLAASGSVALTIGTISAPQPKGMDVEPGAVTLGIGSPDAAPQPAGYDLEPSGTATLAAGNPDPAPAPEGMDVVGDTATLAIGKPEPAPAPQGIDIDAAGAVTLTIGSPDASPQPEGISLTPSESTLAIGTPVPAPQPEGLDLEASGSAPLAIGTITPVAPEGHDLTGSGSVALPVGTPPPSPAPEGIDLAAGTATIDLGTVPAPQPDGVDVEASGSVALSVGTVTAPQPEGHDVEAAGAVTLTVGTPPPSPAPDGHDLASSGNAAITIGTVTSPRPEGMDVDYDTEQAYGRATLSLETPSTVMLTVDRPTRCSLSVERPGHVALSVEAA